MPAGDHSWRAVGRRRIRRCVSCGYRAGADARRRATSLWVPGLRFCWDRMVTDVRRFAAQAVRSTQTAAATVPGSDSSMALPGLAGDVMLIERRDTLESSRTETEDLPRGRAYQRTIQYHAQPLSSWRLMLCRGPIDGLAGRIWVDSEEVDIAQDQSRCEPLGRGTEDYEGFFECYTYFLADGSQGARSCRSSVASGGRATSVNGYSWAWVKLTQNNYGGNAENRIWQKPQPIVEFLLNGRRVRVPGQDRARMVKRNWAAVAYDLALDSGFRARCRLHRRGVVYMQRTMCATRW